MVATDVPSGSVERAAERRAWLPVALAGLALAAALVGLGLGVTPSPEGATIRQNVLGSVATFALTMSFTVVGLILRRSRADNPVG